MEKAYAAWRAFQDRILARAAALVLLGCTLLALLEVVRRYVFGLSFEWSQDAVTFFTLVAVYLYFGNAQRRGAHLNVTVLIEALEALGAHAAVQAIRLGATLFSLAFLLAVLWWGVPELEDGIRYGSRTESLAFLLWPFLAALYAGFAFMAVTLVFQVWREFRALRRRPLPEDPDEGEGAPGH
ncbi:MAG: TRAP transporter small permease [Burkholderiales bacterium]|nr:TRAP transporter small permease [Burkholderiales bacterium]